MSEEKRVRILQDGVFSSEGRHDKGAVVSLSIEDADLLIERNLARTLTKKEEGGKEPAKGSQGNEKKVQAGRAG